MSPINKCSQNNEFSKDIANSLNIRTIYSQQNEENHQNLTNPSHLIHSNSN